MQLHVNDRDHRIAEEWAAESLLSVLREALGLVGTKFGCGVGLCGACTVLLDGEAARACQVRARDCRGRKVTTIEGLAGPDGRLNGLQQAWLDEAVPQCGYCQAGQVMAATALLRANPAPDAAAIEAAMAGILCRCGTQQRIARAIRRAAGGRP